MNSIIHSRKNSPSRRMAERFDCSGYEPKVETPKEWDDLPLYITPKIISAILGVSAPYISKCISNGDLRATKKAGKWFISKEDFRTFMQQPMAKE